MTKNGVVIQPSVNSGYQPKYKCIQPPPTCFKTSFDPMTSEAGDLEEVSEEVEADREQSWVCSSFRIWAQGSLRQQNLRDEIFKGSFLPLIFKVFLKITIQNSINVHFNLTKISSRGELERPVWSGISRLS